MWGGGGAGDDVPDAPLCAERCAGDSAARFASILLPAASPVTGRLCATQLNDIKPNHVVMLRATRTYRMHEFVTAVSSPNKVCSTFRFDAKRRRSAASKSTMAKILRMNDVSFAHFLAPL